MKPFHSLPKRLGAGLALATLAAAIYTWSGTIAVADDSASTKAEKKPTKKLTGAELYAINCNRCHPERYPTEFNSAHWKTLIIHMRVRANLPAKQAKEIIRYMQDESGN